MLMCPHCNICLEYDDSILSVLPKFDCSLCGQEYFFLVEENRLISEEEMIEFSIEDEAPYIFDDCDEADWWKRGEDAPF